MEVHVCNKGERLWSREINAAHCARQIQFGLERKREKKKSGIGDGNGQKKPREYNPNRILYYQELRFLWGWWGVIQATLTARFCVRYFFRWRDMCFIITANEGGQTQTNERIV